MFYSYYGRGRLGTPSFRSNIVFAFSKLNRLYPLHIVLMLAMLLILVATHELTDISAIMTRLLLNVVLVQTYLPLADSSINGVSWYLCVMALSYAVFPWILQRMEDHWTRTRAVIQIVLVIGAMAVAGMFARYVPYMLNDCSGYPGILQGYKLTKWVVYYLPPVRLCEVYIGCNLCYLYLTAERNDTRGVADHLMEAFAFVVAIASLVIATIASGTPQESGTNAIHTDLWWTESLLFLPGSILLVYVFAMGRGVISRLLVNRVTLYIARISPYAFLVHYVVFRYMEGVLHYLSIFSASETYIHIIKATIGFAVTIAACELWMWMNKRCGLQKDR